MCAVDLTRLSNERLERKIGELSRICRGGRAARDEGNAALLAALQVEKGRRIEMSKGGQYPSDLISKDPPNVDGIIASITG